MNIPGFTAEWSFYTEKRYYREQAGGNGADGNPVIAAIPKFGPMPTPKVDVGIDFGGICSDLCAVGSAATGTACARLGDPRLIATCAAGVAAAAAVCRRLC